MRGDNIACQRRAWSRKPCVNNFQHSFKRPWFRKQKMAGNWLRTRSSQLMVISTSSIRTHMVVHVNVPHHVHLRPFPKPWLDGPCTTRRFHGELISSMSFTEPSSFSEIVRWLVKNWAQVVYFNRAHAIPHYWKLKCFFQETCRQTVLYRAKFEKSKLVNKQTDSGTWPSLCNQVGFLASGQSTLTRHQTH